METARVKQDEETDTRVIRNLEDKNVGKKGKSSKQGQTSAKDLSIELSEGHEFPTID